MGEFIIGPLAFIGACFIAGYLKHFFNGSLDQEKAPDPIETILEGFAILIIICIPIVFIGFIVGIISLF